MQAANACTTECDMTSDNFSLTSQSRHQHDEDVPLKVSYEAYVQFDVWLSEQLEELVGRWAHTAAPNAHRGRNGRWQAARQRP